MKITQIQKNSSHRETPLSSENTTALFKSMNQKEKIQYIWDYYKLPLCLSLVLFVILISFIHRQLTKKDIYLYTAAVGVTLGDDTKEKLNENFFKKTEKNPAKNQIYFYENLLLTNEADEQNSEYAYASRIKIMAVIDAEKMDLVLMNKEAFDAFSQSGYLEDLDLFIKENLPEQYEKLQSFLVTNTTLQEAASGELSSKNETGFSEKIMQKTGLNSEFSPILKTAGFNDTVYLGILKNSPRKEHVISYLSYLFPS